MILQSEVGSAATFLVGVFISAALAICAAAAAPSPEDQAPVKQARGIDLGSSAMTVYVARDKATWDKLKQAAGSRHEFPGGALKGNALDRLDGIDFKQEMIVAVFWGEMNFSGHDEKCWIEAVRTGDKEVTVDCRASLWGGEVLRSYRAWPYDVRVVRRSELPVTFLQTTEYAAKPALSEKEKSLATLQPDQWTRQIAPPK